jgi:hypothetical protein
LISLTDGDLCSLKDIGLWRLELLRTIIGLNYLFDVTELTMLTSVFSLIIESLNMTLLVLVGVAALEFLLLYYILLISIYSYDMSTLLSKDSLIVLSLDEAKCPDLRSI